MGGDPGHSLKLPDNFWRSFLGPSSSSPKEGRGRPLGFCGRGPSKPRVGGSRCGAPKCGPQAEMPPPPSACRHSETPGLQLRSFCRTRLRGPCREPHFGHPAPTRQAEPPPMMSPAPPVTPAAPGPQGGLHLARSPPRSAAARGLTLLTCTQQSRPPPGLDPRSPRAARAPLPEPRSPRGPAAPDSRRQGPSPSRPKAGGKRSRESLPRPRSPRSPRALSRRRGGDRGGSQRPGPRPGPRPGAAQGAPANFGGVGARIMAAAAAAPLPRAGTRCLPPPAAAGPREPGPGPGARALNLAALGARRTRPAGRTHLPALREAAGMCAVKFGL